MKLASAGPTQPAPPATNAIPPTRAEVAETSNAVVTKADFSQQQGRVARTELAKLEPVTCRNAAAARRAWHRQRPARRVAGFQRAPAPLAGDGLCRPGEQCSRRPFQQNGAIKPVVPASARSGWIIQVGALESESEAQLRIEAARNQASGMLNKADPFTEPVLAKDNRKLFRARFAGLERDQAEAVCRTLKRADISCITVRN